MPEHFPFLQMISQSVRQVVLDVKVGPPSFEKGLAEDVLSLVSSVYLLYCFVSRSLVPKVAGPRLRSS
jgi:hypothetical protein